MGRLFLSRMAPLRQNLAERRTRKRKERMKNDDLTNDFLYKHFFFTPNLIKIL